MADIIAHTKLDESYPGYINIKRQDDGSVVLTMRGDPSSRAGCFVCGTAKDKGQPGRCTPGDEHCNNYCNMAPEKGPIQPAAAPTTQIFEGPTAVVTLTAEEWDGLAKAIGEGRSDA